MNELNYVYQGIKDAYLQVIFTMTNNDQSSLNDVRTPGRRRGWYGPYQ